jgi:hypothetical protein
MSGGECLSLSHIDSIIQYDYSAEPLSTRQSRVMTAVASLFSEGLVVVGAIVGGTGATVDPWKLSTDETLSRLRELYVTNYDDWYMWGWVVWFELTPDGERAAVRLMDDTS